MNTFLSSSQQAALDQYRAFALDKVAPIAFDLENRKRNLKEFLKELGKSGYLGITVPADMGGGGGSFIQETLFVEAVSQFEPGLGLTLSAHVAAIELIKRYGSDAQKSHYLPRLAKGETIGAVAISEEEAGSDFPAMTTLAAASGDHCKLTGKKSWVVNGAIADLFIVAARRDTEDATFCLFLVDRPARGSAFKVADGPQKLGLRSCHTDSLELKEMKVSQDKLLQPEAGESAIEQILYAMDISKVLIGAAAIGLVEGAGKAAVEHARHRKQFGTNIGQFQAIQWKIADLFTECVAARMLTLRAAWSKDEDAERFHLDAAMCKWFASRVARQHSGEAVQILGAHGLSVDSPTERLFRDAKVMEICQGTSEIQKIIVTEQLGI